MSKKIIEVGMFAYMGDSSFVEHGVKKGDLIYIAGDAIVNTTEKDPYALRRLFVAAFVKDDHIQIHDKPFIVDGKRLIAVSDKNQERLDAIKKEEFTDKDEVHSQD